MEYLAFVTGIHNEHYQFRFNRRPTIDELEDSFRRFYRTDLSIYHGYEFTEEDMNHIVLSGHRDHVRGFYDAYIMYYN